MTADEFDKEVYKRLGEGHTRADAFWDVNLEYEETYGKLRYSDYNSYRVARHNRLRRKS